MRAGHACRQTTASSASQSVCSDTFGNVIGSFAPISAARNFENNVGYSGTPRPISMMWLR